MAATGARLGDDAGRSEAAGRHLEVVCHVARIAIGKATGLHLRSRALRPRHPGCMAMVAMGVMMLRMMAGVISARVTPCAVVRPCRSRRDEYDDGSRTQRQCNETKRPAKRKQLTHT